MPADLAAPIPRIALDGAKPFRRALAKGGRAHVDRPLPFLILNRFESGARDSLARNVAATGSAYVAWPAAPGCDAEAREIVAAIAAAQRTRFDRVLIVSLYDLPREANLDEDMPRLERFDFQLDASDDAPAQRAARRLGRALREIEIDLRRPCVLTGAKPHREPGMEDLIEGGISHLSLGLPQNYRVPGESNIYPELLHELTIEIFDALLQGFHAFLGAISTKRPPHYRALGRRSFIDAARNVDRKLTQIAGSFDCLLCVSPINTAEALARFEACGHDKEPEFRYRPLTIDPDSVKRRLFAIELKRVEDPVLEHLFGEKRRELAQQLTLLQSRNTGAFRYSGLMLYGPVEPPLLIAAREVLSGVAPVRTSDGETVDAAGVHKAAREMIGRYRARNAEFRTPISLREDLAPGLMVSQNNLLISTGTRMGRHRLDAILQHEIGVHLLTYVNGNAQGLKIFRSGLADYEGFQEGLGVFAECASGGLTAARLRWLAARVEAVHAMIDGASFIESFRLLRGHGFGVRAAFNIAARVYRSGGLAKDAIYLRGFRQVLDILAGGSELTPFWFGKVAARHVPVVEELAQRGLLHAPRVEPEFLARPEAQARIALMRTNPSLTALV